jgi:FHS family L-fucose permease-like MFS transporter
MRDLGPHTKEGASLIVMSIIGGAVFTPLMGFVYQATKSMAESMTVPLFCYLVVVGFAFWGANVAPIVNQSREILSEVENECQP